MRVRTFMFDLGNVLFRWAPLAVIEAHGFDGPKTLAATFSSPLWFSLDRGDLTEAEALPRFATEVGCSVAAMSALIHAARASMAPIESGVKLLEELAEDGRDLVALSNMSHETFAELRSKHAFLERFRGILISAEVRLLKPEPAIYAHAIEAFGLDPASTVFIDDHPPNVDAARAMGMGGVVWDGSSSAVEEARAFARRGSDRQVLATTP